MFSTRGNENQGVEGGFTVELLSLMFSLFTCAESELVSDILVSEFSCICDV